MRHAGWLSTFLLLAACGGPASDERAEEPAAEPEREGAFDELTGTIDRAEAVEEQVLEKKRRIDEALEDAETTRDPERG